MPAINGKITSNQFGKATSAVKGKTTNPPCEKSPMVKPAQFAKEDILKVKEKNE